RGPSGTLLVSRTQSAPFSNVPAASDRFACGDREGDSLARATGKVKRRGHAAGSRQFGGSEMGGAPVVRRTDAGRWRRIQLSDIVKLFCVRFCKCFRLTR